MLFVQCYPLQYSPPPPPPVRKRTGKFTARPERVRTVGGVGRNIGTGWAIEVGVVRGGGLLGGCSLSF